ncbi:MAG: hypothetical protein KKC39_04880, partial [Candidatus Omnitrophica bacterium]|nr:hypothetical protein [Candidatus Omnitrophota bacterium]MBU4468054.1 hypothetical protein [Candidatus Omnitrophota bacterium]MCG2707453.1 hypothetical protein [Candidatus Omnitrophota bacterium]
SALSGGLKAVSYPTISHLKLCADGQLAQPKHLIRLDYKELILARNKVLLVKYIDSLAQGGNNVLTDPFFHASLELLGPIPFFKNQKRSLYLFIILSAILRPATIAT